MSDVTTIVFSGSATKRAPETVRKFRGGWLRISDVLIEDHVSYAQHSARHLLHLPLAREMRCAASAVGFTPAGQERCGRTRRGAITGLQLGFEPWFVEACCEQRFEADASPVSDRQIAKTAILARAIAGRGGSACDPIAFDTMMVALARDLGRAYGRLPKRRDDGWLHPAALARVVERLRSTVDCSPSLHDLASDAGLGVSAFIRAFRGSLGVTPAAFALSLRLEKAAEMLTRGDASISEIAAVCGFSSPSHFVSAFGKNRGVTPAQWRKAGRG